MFCLLLNIWNVLPPKYLNSIERTVSVTSLSESGSLVVMLISQSLHLLQTVTTCISVNTCYNHRQTTLKTMCMMHL